MEWGVELPGRLTLKLPTYGKSIANWVTNTLQTLFYESGVPPALKVWLRRTISVVPGMQRSRAWCGTPPILGVVNMVGTRNFTCHMGAL